MTEAVSIMKTTRLPHIIFAGDYNCIHREASNDSEAILKRQYVEKMGQKKGIWMQFQSDINIKEDY